MKPNLFVLGVFCLSLLASVCTGQTKCPQVSYLGRVSLNTTDGKGIDGVKIRINFIGNEVTRPGDNGNFRYTLADCPGTRLRVEATKDGYSVVNHVELASHVLERSAGPGHLQFPVIMCFEKDREDKRIAYYAEIANLAFDRETAYLRGRIQELEKLLTQKDQQKDRLIDSLATYKSRYQETTIDYKRHRLEVLQIAKVFANLATSELDSTYQNAFYLFQQGKLAKVQELLSNQRLDDEQKAYRNEKQASDLLKQSAERKKRFWINKATLKATVYQAQFDITNALIWHERAVSEDSIWFNSVFTFAEFLYKQNRVQQGERWYNRALLIVSTDEEKAKVYNSLGNLYITTQRPIEAEQAYQHALAIREKLAKANPEQFESYLASTIENLGMLYEINQRPNDAELNFQRSLAIRDKLAKIDPLQFDPALANTLNIMGNFYKGTQRPLEAEQAYQRALNICEKLSKSNPDKFEFNLAETLSNLGNLYTDTQRTSNALQVFQRALVLFERLAKINPEEFEPGLATMLNNLGAFYSTSGNQLEAEKAYQRALIILESLAKVSPELFESNLAETVGNMGSSYARFKLHRKAEPNFDRSVVLYKKLVKINPKQFQPKLAHAYSNLGLFYTETQRPLEAEQAYKQSIVLYEDLVKASPEQFDEYLAWTLDNLSYFYLSIQNPVQAEQGYQRALGLYEKLAKANPKQFEPSLARTHYNLGNLYSENKRPTQAEVNFQRALALYEKLAKANPNKFDEYLAIILNDLGYFYASNNRPLEVEQAYQRAFTIRERLAMINSDQFEPQLINTIGNLSLFYWNSNRIQDLDSLLRKTASLYLKWLETGKPYWRSAAIVYSRYAEISKSPVQKVERLTQLTGIYDRRKQQQPQEISAEIVAKVYGDLAWNLLFLQRFTESEIAARMGLSIDPAQTWINTKLAHALLFQGRFSEAQKVYILLQNQTDQQNKLFKEIIISDLAELKEAGISNIDVFKIQSLLK